MGGRCTFRDSTGARCTEAEGHGAGHWIVPAVRVRDEVPAEVHERGWQWRPVGDSAFAPPFGTVRACVDCGCLVVGGPTRCGRCATEARGEAKALEWDEDDLPLPEDNEIRAAHPTRTGRHDLYAEAMRLVGAKRSKGALVDLVVWLLHRASTSARGVAREKDR